MLETTLKSIWIRSLPNLRKRYILHFRERTNVAASVVNRHVQLGCNQNGEEGEGRRWGNVRLEATRTGSKSNEIAVR